MGGALAVAEDYGDLADGLLVLHQATADRRWLTAAGELLDFALAHFTDGGGGFYDTGDDAEALVRRPRDPADGAAPAGSGQRMAVHHTAEQLDLFITSRNTLCIRCSLLIRGSTACSSFC